MKQNRTSECTQVITEPLMKALTDLVKSEKYTDSDRRFKKAYLNFVLNEFSAMYPGITEYADLSEYAVKSA